MSDPQDHIGEYAVRVKKDPPEGMLLEQIAVSQAHKVESRIRGRFVTECGKQMELDKFGRKLQFFAGDPPTAIACQRCFNNI